MCGRSPQTDAMDELFLFGMILVPAVIALPVLLLTSRYKRLGGLCFVFGFAANLALTALSYGRELAVTKSWGGWGVDFSLRLDSLSSLLLVFAAALAFILSIYTVVFIKGTVFSKYYYAAILFTASCVNGALLAGNLLVMLFFWEAILAALFILLAAGNRGHYRTAVKAVVIMGAADLCLTLGIDFTEFLSHTLTTDKIHLSFTPMGAAVFVLLLTGAAAKLGVMPFHSWLTGAANETPAPLLAFLSTMQRLLGVYLLARMCRDFFDLQGSLPAKGLLLTLGVATILFAAVMACAQTDLKRTLVFASISLSGAIPLCFVLATYAGALACALGLLFGTACLLAAGEAMKKQPSRRPPKLRALSDLSEKQWLDPYLWAHRSFRAFGQVSLKINDGISRFYDVLVVRAARGCSALVGKAHNGKQSRYALWVLGGLALTTLLFLFVFR